MVKKGKKDFTSGLDRLIQKTTVSEEVEEAGEIGEAGEAGENGKAGKKSGEKERQITITIPQNLKRTIKKYCAANEITIKELFINSVTRYMKVDENPL